MEGRCHCTLQRAQIHACVHGPWCAQGANALIRQGARLLGVGQNVKCIDYRLWVNDITSGDLNADSASADGYNVAVRGERFPVPAAPPLLQTQPGDPCHEVELARPRVPLRHREQTHALARQEHVTLVDVLCHGIVPQHIEADLVDFDGLGVHVLSLRKR